MTLLERFNKYAWVGVLKYLIANGFFTTTSSGESAGLVAISDIGPITQSRNRLLTAVAKTNVPATNSCTWPAAANIREITITPSGVGTTVAGEDYVLVAFNAANDAIAAAWLDDTTSVADDIQFAKVHIGESKTFRFTSAQTRLDNLAVGGLTTAHVHIGAH